MPDFDVSAWYGLAAPAGVPADLMGRLEKGLEAVSRDAEIVTAMERSGASIGFVNTAGTAAFMAADAAKWKRVVDFAKIRVE